MKVKASLKLACPDCYYVARKGKLYIRCKSFPRHKRRQGFSTVMPMPQGVSQQVVQPTETHKCSNCFKPFHAVTQ